MWDGLDGSRREEFNRWYQQLNPATKPVAYAAMKAAMNMSDRDIVEWYGGLSQIDQIITQNTFHKMGLQK